MSNTQELALLQLQQEPVMQRVIAAEPLVLGLLKIAAEQHEPGERWHAYTALKHMGAMLVGWDARRASLRSTAYYEAYVAAIDLLLPIDEDEGTITPLRGGN